MPIDLSIDKTTGSLIDDGEEICPGLNFAHTLATCPGTFYTGYILILVLGVIFSIAAIASWYWSLKSPNWMHEIVHEDANVQAFGENTEPSASYMTISSRRKRNNQPA